MNEDEKTVFRGYDFLGDGDEPETAPPPPPPKSPALISGGQQRPQAVHEHITDQSEYPIFNPDNKPEDLIVAMTMLLIVGTNGLTDGEVNRGMLFSNGMESKMVCLSNIRSRLTDLRRILMNDPSTNYLAARKKIDWAYEGTLRGSCKRHFLTPAGRVAAIIWVRQEMQKHESGGFNK